MAIELKKPYWLNKKINLGDCARMASMLGDLRLSTVCQEASCPNISECFARKEATFLILGTVCTRDCRFCGVKKGSPGAVDTAEPLRVAQAVQRLSLRHAVITSVTRDDLPDAGASSYIETIRAIKAMTPEVSIEVLIPDFLLNKQALLALTRARPDIIGHNVETVPRLYAKVRQSAVYQRSLEVLESIKEFDSQIYTKSGIMVGLGESRQEVEGVLKDLRRVKCDFLTFGQYLAPSLSHEPVHEYIKPNEFAYYKEKAYEYGFSFVVSSAYARSSYLAADYLRS